MRTNEHAANSLELNLDPGAAEPIYQQLIDQIRMLAATGALRPHDRLPTVRRIAADLRINRNTAARAYRALESEGLIVTRQGGGSFVADAIPRMSRRERRERLQAAVERFLNEAARIGARPSEVHAAMERARRKSARRKITSDIPSPDERG